MQRRDFLKAAAATAAGASSLNATSLISDNLMSDTPAKMSASHFGSVYCPTICFPSNPLRISNIKS